MGDSSVEVTDENREASQEAKGKAMEAISEGMLVYVYGITCCLRNSSFVSIYMCSVAL